MSSQTKLRKVERTSASKIQKDKPQPWNLLCQTLRDINNEMIQKLEVSFKRRDKIFEQILWNSNESLNTLIQIKNLISPQQDIDENHSNSTRSRSSSSSSSNSSLIISEDSNQLPVTAKSPAQKAIQPIFSMQIPTPTRVSDRKRNFAKTRSKRSLSRKNSQSVDVQYNEDLVKQDDTTNYMVKPALYPVQVLNSNLNIYCGKNSSTYFFCQFDSKCPFHSKIKNEVIDHIWSKHFGGSFMCSICNVRIQSRTNTRRHYKQKHQTGKIGDNQLEIYCPDNEIAETIMLPPNGIQISSTAVKVPQQKNVFKKFNYLVNTKSESNQNSTLQGLNQYQDQKSHGYDFENISEHPNATSILNKKRTSCKKLFEKDYDSSEVSDSDIKIEKRKDETPRKIFKSFNSRKILETIPAEKKSSQECLKIVTGCLEYFGNNFPGFPNN